MLHKAYMYIFYNEFFPLPAVQQRQHVDAVERRTFFSRLLIVFVCDILYIRSGCINLVVAALHPFFTFIPWIGSGPHALLAEDRIQS